MKEQPGPQSISDADMFNRDDVFSYLGMHKLPTKDALVVRAYLPWAKTVEVIDAKSGKKVAALNQDRERGLFEGVMGRRRKRFHYRLRINDGNNLQDVEDPYRFPSILSDDDRYFFAEGSSHRAYDWMGARLATVDGVDGTLFVLWAPNASRVSILGDFNHWSAQCHVMRKHPANGLWELFMPNVQHGACYKYEIHDADGRLLPTKSDPYALAVPQPGDTASMVYDTTGYTWEDQQWMESRRERNCRDAPVSIYEAHLGSWKRHIEEGNRYLRYAELAQQLIPYVKALGFTHIQLMPVSEYPFDGSWGYQPIGLFAPTSRFGSPDDFKHFVDCCHQAGLGLILDWVPGHFPTDEHGLGRFDGTALYEHEDPRRGFHPDWNTLIYNYERGEVVSYLLSNAQFWFEQYHVDGLRVDAVASMLYLDYSRQEGEWLPNEKGGRENLGAIKLLQLVNERIYGEHPDVMTIAEESTAWPGVSKPTSSGGLGFGFKWNMGWMNDTLRYMSRNPIHRSHHHSEITFGLTYAFSENFILPLSHDEVVHGKGSLLGRMPGDEWQKFANLRAFFGFMWTHPGKKLLFQGGEFAQRAEWNHDRGLDWQLLDAPMHAGVQQLVKDLNHLYLKTPALYALDCEDEGFEWLVVDDSDNSVFAYLRKGREGTSPIIVVSNLTPVVHPHFRLGVPLAGVYREVLNTDSNHYGGSNVGNAGGVEADNVGIHGRSYSICLQVPPLATLIFELTTG